jgi:small multidrug resistance family-3 protein
MNYFWYIFAAICEIAGCYAFWMWLRLGRNALWIIPGIIILALFAFALTKIDTSFAGRSYAAYGGIYILSSVVWLRWVENERLIFSDYIGVLICLIGSITILYGARLAN